MSNEFNELFFKSGLGCKQHPVNKINGKRYFLNLLFDAMTISLILIGIFCHPIFDSAASVLVLSVLAMMSAMDYKK
jgi:hypothetical protein